MKIRICFMMMLIAIAFSSCKKDPDPDPNPISLVGTWFTEEQNEELRFSAGSTFYGRYCFEERAWEGEGIYEIDSKNKRLTMTYYFMGQNQYLDWKLTNYNDYSITLSSESMGLHQYYKVVDTFNFDAPTSAAVWEQSKLDGRYTVDILSSKNIPSTGIISFKSLNENIASVSSDGTITANGEKGTTYIKVQTSTDTFYVKVVVGVDRLDFWIDYSVLLGKDVTQVRSYLGTPSQTDEDCYAYELTQHDILQYVLVFFDEYTHKVDEIDLHCLDYIPSADILSYVKDKYYYYDDTGYQKWYMTSPSIKSSRAVVVYFQADNIVVMTSADPYKSSHAKLY